MIDNYFFEQKYGLKPYKNIQKSGINIFWLGVEEYSELY